LRIAFFSDVHSNLEALTAVQKEIRKQAPDRLFFLGDAVGYGPDPNACVEKIFEMSDVVVAGNHDHAAVDRTEIDYFNLFALEAILWTRSVLSDANRERILSMPLTVQEEDLFLVHASPDRPEEWDYIVNERAAGNAFSFFEEKVCLYGHTHLPMAFEDNGNKVLWRQESRLTFQETFRYIVNVGSVGQPRDGNPDAAYVILDSREKSLSFHRVPYNYRVTQEKMRAAQLPSFLIERLEDGR
jgi:predicted phosphodiesterase